MARPLQPSIAFSIASGRASSRKNSAGPPIPNEVREASGSSCFTPGSARSQARLDLVRQVIAQLFDVAGAHQENEVVGAHDLLERLPRLVEVAHVNAVRNLVREVRGLDARDVLFARAVDVEHEDAVRALECARKVVHQRVQARVAMRLEDYDQPSMTQLACRFDGRTHLGRMVRVVVVDGRTLEHAEKFHPAMSSGKTVQRCGDVLETDAELERHGRRGGRVLDVVAPWLAQVDAPEEVEAPIEGKRALGLTPI